MYLFVSCYSGEGGLLGAAELVVVRSMNSAATV